MRAAVLLLLLLTLLTPLTAVADQQGVIGFPVDPDAEPTRPPGNIYVRGIASHAWWLDPEVYGDQLSPALDELQVTTVRLSIDWRRFEPEPGVWDWAMYDRVLGDLARRNIVIVADFNTIPGWASTDPVSCDTPPLEVPTCQLREDMYDEFANAMRAAVERYSWIQHWEFWNEPELWTYLGKDGPLYVRHLRMFYDIAHEVNPDVVVAAQTLVGPEYMDWLYNISDAEYGDDNEPWDAVSVHPYNFYYVPAPGEPALEINYDRIQQLRQMMIDRGDADKKIWITEFGWTNDEQWQARNLPVTLDWLQSQPYIAFAHLHMLHDWNEEPQDQFGLMRIVERGGYRYLDEDTVFEPKELYYNTFKNYPMNRPGRPPDDPEALTFTETGHSIAEPFLSGWSARGGLAGPGLPLTRPYVRQDLNGDWMFVQDFERARLEYHPEFAGEPAEILGAPVGRELALDHPEPEHFTTTQPCVASDDRLCFPGVDFGVEAGFRDFWLSNNGEVRFGFPISGEFRENGVVVQYYERARLEWHPELPVGEQIVVAPIVQEQLIDLGWLLLGGTPGAV
ncbi:MAG: cellulase family glycosylhydrolase [Thermomicrobiales bacterium]